MHSPNPTAMHLEILTPDKKVFAGDADELFVPGTSGAFEILRNHAPIISTLSRGSVRIRTSGKPELDFLIPRGVVEVQRNQVVVLAESATVYCTRFNEQCARFGGQCTDHGGTCFLA